MIDLIKIQKAIKFATKTHQVYDNQTRKGKEKVPYIIHPLGAGIILATVGASTDVICAGILHDTIEDSKPSKKVTFEMLKDRFGEAVANMVLDVTEKDKTLSWDVRKERALEEIKTFDHDSLLVKSADVINNLTELLDDHARDGNETFERFNATKEESIRHSLLVIKTLTARWPESPLAKELSKIAKELVKIDKK